MLIREDCPNGEKKYEKISGLERGTQMSYQRSWKNSRLEKRNIWENFCLRTGTLTDSKGFCENSSLGKGKVQA